MPLSCSRVRRGCLFGGEEKEGRRYRFAKDPRRDFRVARHAQFTVDIVGGAPEYRGDTSIAYDLPHIHEARGSPTGRFLDAESHMCVVEGSAVCGAFFFGCSR
jgi:hypothetical protein